VCALTPVRAAHPEHQCGGGEPKQDARQHGSCVPCLHPNTNTSELTPIVFAQGNDFDGASGLMGGTLKKLNNLVGTAGSGKHMYILVAFVVFVFLAVYFIILR
jgi:hypothetical protein